MEIEGWLAVYSSISAR